MVPLRPFDITPRAAALLAAVSLAVGSSALVLAASGPGPTAGPGVDDALGVPVIDGKSATPLHDRYGALVIRQPSGEETAGLIVDMSGRSERWNDGIYVYTDSRRLDHTAGIQVQNVGAADAMHINIGCKGCPPETNAHANTGIGIDQWSNGTGFFTFVHGNGRGLDAVLYPSAEGARAATLRAAHAERGSGDLLHLDNGGNPRVLAINVARGEANLRETRFHGPIDVERAAGDDTHALRFVQHDHHTPALDANAGWLRVLDATAGDRERFMVEASTGNVRLHGRLGAGPDDGTRAADSTGAIAVSFAHAYAAAPLVSCTPEGPFACYILERSGTHVVLQLAALAPGADVSSARADVVVRGL